MLRYVPNVVRAEFVNFGVILVKEVEPGRGISFHARLAKDALLQSKCGHRSFAGDAGTLARRVVAHTFMDGGRRVFS